MKTPPVSEDVRLLPEFVCKAVNEEEKLPSVPSTKHYREGLLELSDRVTTKQRALLEAHYRSPGHKATASKLAAAVGYADYRAVNSQYGKLGAMLREALNYTAEGQASYVLASFTPPSSGRDQWVFVMHPELALALKQLGWV